MPAQIDDVGALLVRARALEPKLAAAADGLNESIQAVEDAFISLKLGVRASVELTHDAQTGWSQQLVFGKTGHGWRLLVDEGRGDAREQQPLRNASRTTRLLAVQHLPALLEAMIAAVEAELERTTQASAIFEQFAHLLRTEV